MSEKRLEFSTLLGITVGICTIILGMKLKGASPAALINPAALVIIFVGTTAALLNAFPMKEFAKIVTMFGLVFKGRKAEDRKEIARQFVRMTLIARKEGLLSLENIINEIENSFMRTGVAMVVDGIEAESIEEVLDSEIEAMQDRHKLGVQIFAQAGMYAPTLGVLGAVIGLVAALGNLNDIEKLGYSIAAAFIATLFGIFTGYVLWHPFSNKLKQISKEEVEDKKMIIQGLLALQAGNPPLVVQIKMLAFIPEGERDELRKEWGRK